jgi:hypothetical protein
MLTPLKDLIPKSANKFKLQGEMNAMLVITRANAVLKETFSSHICRAVHVKRFTSGVLWCAVENAAVAQEVQLKSSIIINALNDSLGLLTVKSIRSYQVAPEPEEIFT